MKLSEEILAEIDFCESNTVKSFRRLYNRMITTTTVVVVVVVVVIIIIIIIIIKLKGRYTSQI
jgi:hypothetical protein